VLRKVNLQTIAKVEFYVMLFNVLDLLLWNLVTVVTRAVNFICQKCYDNEKLKLVGKRFHQGEHKISDKKCTTEKALTEVQMDAFSYY